MFTGDEGILHCTPNYSPSASVDGITVSATSDEQGKMKAGMIKLVERQTSQQPHWHWQIDKTIW